ncbi:MAG: hypothetical protein HOG03_14280 [Desulfobacula sp.]|jgi:hypothetical protein|uniref:hypothetical protein n=1 Tax=Desulfobacula sp. TaxID=2593537 RepID=UPI001D45FCEB|nr:hypothetical protein [Desulfobacula sp.]MBT3805744.1 hypothetical protein [Desulfobacula sp.]MBT4023927.1 hypothetical protein [Desulfobacula sp.]MBT4200333.1 hypothetical protein [Desulfobacula sp.]MBT4508388.1 hypothetical protein [Desulfobacula sp.]
MLKKTSSIGFIVLFITVLFISEPSSAVEDSSILMGVTTGKGRITSQNLQQAKQNAVYEALKVAVQNAFAKIVSKQVFASNLDFFYSQVLPHASDYIITYQVLGGIENKGYYLVGVESKVDIHKLEKTLTDARILNANKDKPVILFFIVEKTPSDLLPKYWWGKNPIPYQPLAETIIIEQLIQDRFIITGNDSVRPDPSFYNITFNSIYDVAAAKGLGKKMDADMIVFGKAVSEEAINRMGEEKTFNSQIDLEGYNLETGEKVVTSQVQAVVKSDMENEGNIQALIKAASLSAQDLSKQLNEYWTGYLRKEHAFDVTIKGKNFLPRFIALKQQFKQMSGIENMQPKELGTDYAVMEIFYKGKSSQFADAVMLKTFDSFGLEFSDITDTLVTIKFIEKNADPLIDDSKNKTPSVDKN